MPPEEAMVLWEDTSRFPYCYEDEKNIEDWIDPRDALFLAHYMATGDVRKAAETVGYPIELAGKYLKSQRATNWMRAQQRKRLARCEVDADELLSRLNEMSKDALRQYEKDPEKNRVDRAFAKECLMDIIDLLGLNKKGGSGDSSNGQINIIFGPGGTPAMAGNSNPQRPVISISGRNDVPGGLQPPGNRSLEPRKP
jgi:hypothetical protein